MSVIAPADGKPSRKRRRLQRWKRLKRKRRRSLLPNRLMKKSRPKKSPKLLKPKRSNSRRRRPLKAKQRLIRTKKRRNNDSWPPDRSFAVSENVFFAIDVFLKT